MLVVPVVSVWWYTKIHCLKIITGYGSLLRGVRANGSPMLSKDHGKILKITNVLVHKQHGLDNL